MSKTVSVSRLLPAFIALLIVVGNVAMALPIWGFDYYVLGLPHRTTSEVISNLFVLAVGFYPLISGYDGRYGYGYGALVLFALVYVAIRGFLFTWGWFAGIDLQRESTASIYEHPFVRMGTYAVLISYFLWVLKQLSVNGREAAIVWTSAAISSGAACVLIWQLIERGSF